MISKGLNSTGESGAQYRHPSGFFARADFIGYFNAKVGWEFENIDWYIYGNNIFNTEYDANGYFSFYNLYSPPGEVGMKLVWRF